MKPMQQEILNLSEHENRPIFHPRSCYYLYISQIICAAFHHSLVRQLYVYRLRKRPSAISFILYFVYQIDSWKSSVCICSGRSKV